MRVCSTFDARVGRCPEQASVEVLVLLMDDLPQLVGYGEDQVNGGDRQEFLPALGPPRLGVLPMACGATAMAARVVDVMFLATGLARQ